jgi:hypothetical protein
MFAFGEEMRFEGGTGGRVLATERQSDVEKRTKNPPKKVNGTGKSIG